MRKESGPRDRRIGILGCFFLSGAAGLVYQVAWAKALGLIFGHTIYAAAVVLGVFMAGLASGSVYLGRRAEGHTNPVALYARIEFLIAATGALSLAGLAAVRSLYGMVYPAVSGLQLPLLALRLFGIAATLFIPTFLMGGTLPILVHSVVRNFAELGTGVSQLYWVNTLGAAAGTLIAGFVLLPTWGLRATICCAVAANALAGLIALWIPNENRSAPAVKVLPKKGNPDRNTPQQATSRVLLFLFAVVGSTAFAYEIAWTRLLAITIGSSTYAFTLMLAAFLLGTVIGSAFFHRFFAGSGRISITTFSRTQIGIGMAALSSLVLFPWVAGMVPELLRKADQAFGGLVLTQFVVSALAMLPTAIIFGFNFPMVVVLIDRSDADRTGNSVTVGKAYAANTIGCIVGAVVTGFWLVPSLGSFRVIATAAGVNILLAVVLDSRAPQRHILHLAIDLCCLVLAVVVGSSSLFNNQPLLMLSAVLYGNSHERRLTFGEVVATTDLVFAEDGVNDSIAVVRTDGNVSLRVNGKVDASTGDARTQLLLGHLGAVFHSMPRRVLIVGFGSGMTASAVARYPDVEEIDCVEIEPAVIHAAPYLGSLNRGVLSDTRVHVIFDDARNFLLTSRQKYDLIISEPSNPWIAGIATLFTDEFYAAARQRLAPGGIFVQWVQSYSLDPADLGMIMATFAPHFAEVTLWRGEETDLLLLGRTDTAPLQFNRLRALWQNQALRADLESIDVREPEGVVAYFLLDDAAVRKLGDGSALNTDDRTLLEYHAPETMLMRGLSDANEELITQFKTKPLPANLEPAEVRRAVDAAAETALDLNDTRNAKSLIGILESQPGSAQGYVARGRFAMLQGNLPDAKSFLAKALAIDSGSPQAMHWLAVAEHRSGDDASAQLHASQILQRHPGFLPALEDEMLFAADRKDFQLALRAQLQRMALMSDPPASEYCRLGAIWMRLSNPTAAEPVFLKGTLKDPYSYACHLGLGELYRETGRFSLARLHFERVVRFFPDADATIFRSLAGVYVVLGDMKSARSSLRKGRRIFPDDTDLKNAEAHFDNEARP
jgi:spermidine synthase